MPDLALNPTDLDPFLGKGIEAFHASGADFSQFDPSKIGTGQGAQTFGHGFYVAENPDVAKTYMPTGWKGNYQLNGRDLTDVYQDAQNKGDYGAAAAYERILLHQSEPQIRSYFEGDDSDQSRRALQVLDTLPKDIYAPSKGHMYQVNVKADPGEMLDYDKPLSDQPGIVAKLKSSPQYQQMAAANHFGYSPQEFAALPQDRQQKLISQTPQSVHDTILTPTRTGANLYDSFSSSFGGEDKASQALSDAGIKGIRYLDQGSRYTVGGQHVLTEQKPDGSYEATIRMDRNNLGFAGPGTAFTKKSFPTKEAADAWANDAINANGTRNMVIFDPKTLDIVKKYGLAAAMGAGGAAAAGATDKAFAADQPQAKDGGTLTPQPARPDVNAAAGVAANFAGDLTGVNSARKALAGNMTEDEAKMFAVTSAMGLLPGPKAASTVETVAQKAAKYLPTFVKDFGPDANVMAQHAALLGPEELSRANLSRAAPATEGVVPRAGQSLAKPPQNPQINPGVINGPEAGKTTIVGGNSAPAIGGADASTTQLRDGRGLGDGRGGLSEASGAPGSPGAEDPIAAARAEADRAAAGHPKLQGLPDAPLNVQGQPFVPGPIGAIHDIADKYMKDAGLPYDPPKTFAKVDKDRATNIAQAFDDMKHDPGNPDVRKSYNAMIDETLNQYQAIKKAGIKFEFIKPGQPDPYADTPRGAAKDVIENKHLWVFPTDSGFGTTSGPAQTSALQNNPLLRPTGETIDGKPLVANDVFRIVHDVMGHLKDGNGFRADGEENAWRSHSAMYSDLARPAMTTETRGQNSWVNWGPYGAANRKATAADTHFADQKIGLLPQWAIDSGRKD